MKISQIGIDLIKSFEGCRLIAYKPVPTEKYWTIGFGSYGPHVRQGQVITQAKAEEMLKDEIAGFEKGVNDLVKVSLNQNQFDALVSFAYNCGLGNLKSSSLLTYVNQKEFTKAANEFSKWKHAGGQVLKGLVRRREAEKNLFLKEAPAASKPKASGRDQIKAIQITLNSRYLTGLTVDGFYGPATRGALVKGLQKELNRQDGVKLALDGIWGSKTKAACVNVRMNASGNVVWILQAALFCNGYDPEGVDGIFGKNTGKALLAFQKAKRIAQDGIAGPNTFEKLFA